MKLKAYAKLNLSLSVTGRLENGMHTLDMIMQNISVFDMIEILPAARLQVDCGDIPLGEKNTVVKAAKLFFEATGIKKRAQISVEKNIPTQAGLGGGSADAAATLIGLNKVLCGGLSVEEMKHIGVRIGADVPFFVEGGCRRAKGIGEDLTPILNNCEFHYLLVKPKEGVSTQMAFAAYHQTPQIFPNIAAAVRALREGNAKEYFECAANALSNAAELLCPSVLTVQKDLKKGGARFAMMTGSGSCVFGIFDSEQKRKAAAQQLSQKYPFVCEASNEPFGVEAE